MGSAAKDHETAASGSPEAVFHCDGCTPPKPMDGLRAWLADAETGWSEQLAGFKAHVERA